MSNITPEVLGLLFVCGIALFVALIYGGRIKARIGRNSIDAGAGARIRGVSAGRDVHMDAKGDAVTVTDIHADRDVKLKLHQNSGD